MRFAPIRSARNPQTILPLSEPSARQAEHGGSRHRADTMVHALATMWKMGPECAAQQAKKVSAMAANCGVRSACATVNSGAPGWPTPPARQPAARPAARARAGAVGTMTTHATSPITSMAVRQS